MKTITKKPCTSCIHSRKIGYTYYCHRAAYIETSHVTNHSYTANVIDCYIERYKGCKGKYFKGNIKYRFIMWIYNKLTHKTCKTCGYRNKINGHCTLNQLSKKVDDDFSCNEYKER